MKLDELQSVQSRERQTDQLQQLRATFYQDAGEFIAQLREERERAAERADDPFDAPEVNRLSDDIRTAEQTVEAVYERRVGKIVKMASLAAADMPTNEDGLTKEERTLFETMVEAIEQNRGHVLDVVAGEAPTGSAEGETDSTQTADPSPTADDATSTPTEPTPSSEESVDTGVDAADIMGGGDGQSTPPQETADPEATADDDAADSSAADRPAEEALSAIGDDARESPPEEPSVEAPNDDVQADGSGATDVDRKTVRITDDVGEIFGVDQREYDLSTDDVVTLPADNADPLVERDAAEPLE
jgi:DNA replication factor GINS